MTNHLEKIIPEEKEVSLHKFLMHMKIDINMKINMRIYYIQKRRGRYYENEQLLKNHTTF